MSDIPRGPSVADEAAEWLATLTDPACTVEERQAFVVWLKRSNLHVDEFLRISALTKRLARPDLWPPESVAELIAQATSASQSVRSFPDSTTPRARIRPAGRHRMLRWAVIACAAPLLLAIALLAIRFDPFAWAPGTYATSIGELRSITLEDGSVVELNTSSRIRTRFTPAERLVELQRGEAVFKVAKNANRPFRVLAGTTEIVAVGTEFNVYARERRTVVTVLEGRVRVMDKDDAPRSSGSATDPSMNVELAPGEQAVIAPDAPIKRVARADLRKVTSWTERRLIFDDTPLSAAAEEFARYNTRRIRIGDPKLGELRISGVFNATDPGSLVQFVEAYASVRVEADNRGWTIVGSAAPPEAP